MLLRIAQKSVRRTGPCRVPECMSLMLGDGGERMVVSSSTRARSSTQIPHSDTEARATCDSDTLTMPSVILCNIFFALPAYTVAGSP